MLKFYYTVAGETKSQTLPHYSLGGYISASPVPNDVLGSIFNEISLYDQQSDVDTHYICLALFNEGVTQDNITMYVDAEEGMLTDTVISVGVVSPYNGKTSININTEAKPLGVEFHEIKGELNAINIGSLASGEWVAVWLSRKIDFSAVKAELSDRDVMKRYLAERFATEAETPNPTNDFFPSDAYLTTLGLTKESLSEIKQLPQQEVFNFIITSEDNI